MTADWARGLADIAGNCSASLTLRWRGALVGLVKQLIFIELNNMPCFDAV